MGSVGYDAWMHRRSRQCGGDAAGGHRAREGNESTYDEDRTTAQLPAAGADALRPPCIWLPMPSGKECAQAHLLISSSVICRGHAARVCSSDRSAMPGARLYLIAAPPGCSPMALIV